MSIDIFNIFIPHQQGVSRPHTPPPTWGAERSKEMYCGRGGLLFLPPTFQGMICQCSLLRAASPNLKHLPVGKYSRTVAPSCGPAHFQSPSYSKGATLTIYIILFLLKIFKWYVIVVLLHNLIYLYGKIKIKDTTFHFTVVYCSLIVR